MVKVKFVMNLVSELQTSIDVELALLAEAKRNLAKADAQPWTVTAHDELKRLLLEKRIETLGRETHSTSFEQSGFDKV